MKQGKIKDFTSEEILSYNKDTHYIANAIGCLKCGEIIYSKHRHDFKWCGCGAIAIDGGRDYTKITGYDEDYTWIKNGILVKKF